eukprot:gene9286-6528_t
MKSKQKGGRKSSATPQGGVPAAAPPQPQPQRRTALFVACFALFASCVAVMVLIMTPVPLDVFPGLSSAPCHVDEGAYRTPGTALQQESRIPLPRGTAEPLVDQIVFILLDALRPDYVHPDFLIDAATGGCARRPSEELEPSCAAAAGKEQVQEANVIRFLQESLLDPDDASLGFFSLADPPTTTMQRILALTTGTIPQMLNAVMRNFFFASDNSASSADQNADETGQKDSLMWQLRGRSVFVGDDSWSQLYPNKGEADGEAMQMRGNVSAAPDYWKTAMGLFSYDIGDYHSVDQLVFQNLFRILEEETVEKAISAARSSPTHLPPVMHAPLVIGHIIGMDHVGHHLGAIDVPEMAQKAVEYDLFLRNLTAALEARETDMTTLLLVMGDHGVTPRGNHGGGTQLERNTFAFAKFFAGGGGGGGQTKTQAPETSDTAPASTTSPAEHRSKGRSRFGAAKKHAVHSAIATRKAELLEPDLQAVLQTCDAPNTTSGCPTKRYPAPHKLSGVEQLDFTATIALLLGVPIPFHNVGRLIPELVHLVQKEDEETDAATFRQQADRVVKQLEFCNWKQMERQRENSGVAIRHEIHQAHEMQNPDQDPSAYRRAMVRWSNYAHKHCNSAFSSVPQLCGLIVGMHVVGFVLLKVYGWPMMVLAVRDGQHSLSQTLRRFDSRLRAELGSPAMRRAALVLQTLPVVLAVLVFLSCTLRGGAYVEDRLLCTFLATSLAIRTVVLQVYLPMRCPARVGRPKPTPGQRSRFVPAFVGRFGPLACSIMESLGFLALVCLSPLALRAYSSDEIIPEDSPFELALQRLDFDVEFDSTRLWLDVVGAVRYAPVVSWLVDVGLHVPYVLAGCLWWLSSRCPGAHHHQHHRVYRAMEALWCAIVVALCSASRGLPVLHHVTPFVLWGTRRVVGRLMGDCSCSNYFIFSLWVISLCDYSPIQRSTAVVTALFTTLLPRFFYHFCFDDSLLPLEPVSDRHAVDPATGHLLRRSVFFFSSLQKGLVVYLTAAYGFFVSGQQSTFETIDWQAAAVGLPLLQSAHHDPSTTNPVRLPFAHPGLEARYDVVCQVVARWVRDVGLLPSAVLCSVRNFYPLLLTLVAYRLAELSARAVRRTFGPDQVVVVGRVRRSYASAVATGYYYFGGAVMKAVFLLVCVGLWGSTIGAVLHFHHINFVTILQLRYIYEFVKMVPSLGLGLGLSKMSNLPPIRNQDAATSVSTTRGGAASSAGGRNADSSGRDDVNRNLVYNNGEPLPPVEFIVTKDTLPPYNALSDPNLLPYWSRQAELIDLRKEQKEQQRRARQEEERQQKKDLKELQERQRRREKEAKERQREEERERQREEERRKERERQRQRHIAARRRRQRRKEAEQQRRLEQLRRRQEEERQERERQRQAILEAEKKAADEAEEGGDGDPSGSGRRHHRRHRHRHYHRNRYGEIREITEEEEEERRRRREEMTQQQKQDETELQGEAEGVRGSQYSSCIHEEAPKNAAEDDVAVSDTESESESGSEAEPEQREQEEADPHCKEIQTDPCDPLSVTEETAESTSLCMPGETDEDRTSGQDQTLGQDRTSGQDQTATNTGAAADDDDAEVYEPLHVDDAEVEDEEVDKTADFEPAPRDPAAPHTSRPSSSRHSLSRSSKPASSRGASEQQQLGTPGSTSEHRPITSSSATCGNGVEKSGSVKFNNNTVLNNDAMQAQALPSIRSAEETASLSPVEAEELRQAASEAQIARDKAKEDAQAAAVMRARAEAAYEEAREAALEAREAADILKAAASASSGSRMNSREGTSSVTRDRAGAGSSGMGSAAGIENPPSVALGRPSVSPSPPLLGSVSDASSSSLARRSIPKVNAVDEKGEEAKKEARDGVALPSALYITRRNTKLPTTLQPVKHIKQRYGIKKGGEAEERQLVHQCVSHHWSQNGRSRMKEPSGLEDVVEEKFQCLADQAKAKAKAGYPQPPALSRQTPFPHPLRSVIYVSTHIYIYKNLQTAYGYSFFQNMRSIESLFVFLVSSSKKKEEAMHRRERMSTWSIIYKSNSTRGILPTSTAPRFSSNTEVCAPAKKGVTGVFHRPLCVTVYHRMCSSYYKSLYTFVHTAVVLCLLPTSSYTSIKVLMRYSYAVFRSFVLLFCLNNHFYCIRSLCCCSCVTVCLFSDWFLYYYQQSATRNGTAGHSPLPSIQFVESREEHKREQMEAPSSSFAVIFVGRHSFRGGAMARISLVECGSSCTGLFTLHSTHFHFKSYTQTQTHEYSRFIELPLVVAPRSYLFVFFFSLFVWFTLFIEHQYANWERSLLPPFSPLCVCLFDNPPSSFTRTQRVGKKTTVRARGTSPGEEPIHPSHRSFTLVEEPLIFDYYVTIGDIIKVVVAVRSTSKAATTQARPLRCRTHTPKEKQSLDNTHEIMSKTLPPSRDRHSDSGSRLYGAPYAQNAAKNREEFNRTQPASSRSRTRSSQHSSPRRSSEPASVSGEHHIPVNFTLGPVQNSTLPPYNDLEDPHLADYWARREMLIEERRRRREEERRRQKEEQKRQEAARKRFLRRRRIELEELSSRKGYATQMKEDEEEERRRQRERQRRRRRLPPQHGSTSASREPRSLHAKEEVDHQEGGSSSDDDITPLHAEERTRRDPEKPKVPSTRRRLKRPLQGSEPGPRHKASHSPDTVSTDSDECRGVKRPPPKPRQRKAAPIPSTKPKEQLVKDDKMQPAEEEERVVPAEAMGVESGVDRVHPAETLQATEEERKTEAAVADKYSDDHPDQSYNDKTEEESKAAEPLQATEGEDQMEDEPKAGEAEDEESKPAEALQATEEATADKYSDDEFDDSTNDKTEEESKAAEPLQATEGEDQMEDEPKAGEAEDEESKPAEALQATEEATADKYSDDEFDDSTNDKTEAESKAAEPLQATEGEDKTEDEPKAGEAEDEESKPAEALQATEEATADKYSDDEFDDSTNDKTEAESKAAEPLQATEGEDKTEDEPKAGEAEDEESKPAEALQATEEATADKYSDDEFDDSTNDKTEEESKAAEPLQATEGEDKMEDEPKAGEAEDEESKPAEALQATEEATADKYSDDEFDDSTNDKTEEESKAAEPLQATEGEDKTEDEPKAGEAEDEESKPAEALQATEEATADKYSDDEFDDSTNDKTEAESKAAEPLQATEGEDKTEDEPKAGEAEDEESKPAEALQATEEATADKYSDDEFDDSTNDKTEEESKAAEPLQATEGEDKMEDEPKAGEAEDEESKPAEALQATEEATADKYSDDEFDDSTNDKTEEESKAAEPLQATEGEDKTEDEPKAGEAEDEESKPAEALQATEEATADKYSDDEFDDSTNDKTEEESKAAEPLQATEGEDKMEDEPKAGEAEDEESKPAEALQATEEATADKYSDDEFDHDEEPPKPLEAVEEEKGVDPAPVEVMDEDDYSSDSDVEPNAAPLEAVEEEKVSKPEAVESSEQVSEKISEKGSDRYSDDEFDHDEEPPKPLEAVEEEKGVDPAPVEVMDEDDYSSDSDVEPNAAPLEAVEEEKKGSDRYSDDEFDHDEEPPKPLEAVEEEKGVDPAPVEVMDEDDYSSDSDVEPNAAPLEAVEEEKVSKPEAIESSEQVSEKISEKGSDRYSDDEFDHDEEPPKPLEAVEEEKGVDPAPVEVMDEDDYSSDSDVEPNAAPLEAVEEEKVSKPEAVESSEQVSEKISEKGSDRYSDDEFDHDEEPPKPLEAVEEEMGVDPAPVEVMDEDDYSSDSDVEPNAAPLEAVEEEKVSKPEAIESSEQVSEKISEKGSDRYSDDEFDHDEEPPKPLEAVEEEKGVDPAPVEVMDEDDYSSDSDVEPNAAPLEAVEEEKMETMRPSASKSRESSNVESETPVPHASASLHASSSSSVEEEYRSGSRGASHSVDQLHEPDVLVLASRLLLVFELLYGVEKYMAKEGEGDGPAKVLLLSAATWECTYRYEEVLVRAAPLHGSIRAHSLTHDLHGFLSFYLFIYFSHFWIDIYITNMCVWGGGGGLFFVGCSSDIFFCFYCFLFGRSYSTRIGDTKERIKAGIMCSVAQDEESLLSFCYFILTHTANRCHYGTAVSSINPHCLTASPCNAGLEPPPFPNLDQRFPLRNETKSFNSQASSFYPTSCGFCLYVSVGVYFFFCIARDKGELLIVSASGLHIHIHRRLSMWTGRRPAVKTATGPAPAPVGGRSRWAQRAAVEAELDAARRVIEELCQGGTPTTSQGVALPLADVCAVLGPTRWRPKVPSAAQATSDAPASMDGAASDSHGYFEVQMRVTRRLFTVPVQGSAIAPSTLAAARTAATLLRCGGSARERSNPWAAPSASSALSHPLLRFFPSPLVTCHLEVHFTTAFLEGRAPFCDWCPSARASNGGLEAPGGRSQPLPPPSSDAAAGGTTLSTLRGSAHHPIPSRTAAATGTPPPPAWAPSLTPPPAAMAASVSPSLWGLFEGEEEVQGQQPLQEGEEGGAGSIPPACLSPAAVQRLLKAIEASHADVGDPLGGSAPADDGSCCPSTFLTDVATVLLTMALMELDGTSMYAVSGKGGPGADGVPIGGGGGGGGGGADLLNASDSAPTERRLGRGMDDVGLPPAVAGISTGGGSGVGVEGSAAFPLQRSSPELLSNAHSSWGGGGAGLPPAVAGSPLSSAPSVYFPPPSSSSTSATASAPPKRPAAALFLPHGGALLWRSAGVRQRRSSDVALRRTESDASRTHTEDDGGEQHHAVSTASSRVGAVPPPHTHTTRAAGERTKRSGGGEAYKGLDTAVLSLFQFSMPLPPPSSSSSPFPPSSPPPLHDMMFSPSWRFVCVDAFYQGRPLPSLLRPSLVLRGWRGPVLQEAGSAGPAASASAEPPRLRVCHSHKQSSRAPQPRRSRHARDGGHRHRRDAPHSDEMEEDVRCGGYHGPEPAALAAYLDQRDRSERRHIWGRHTRRRRAVAAAVWRDCLVLYSGGSAASALLRTAAHCCHRYRLGRVGEMLRSLAGLVAGGSTLKGAGVPASCTSRLYAAHLLGPLLEEIVHRLQARRLPFLAGVALCNALLPVILSESEATNVPVLAAAAGASQDGVAGLGLELGPPPAPAAAVLAPVTLPPLTNWAHAYLAVAYVERVCRLVALCGGGTPLRGGVGMGSSSGIGTRQASRNGAAEMAEARIARRALEQYILPATLYPDWREAGVCCPIRGPRSSTVAPAAAAAPSSPKPSCRPFCVGASVAPCGASALPPLRVCAICQLSVEQDVEGVRKGRGSGWHLAGAYPASVLPSPPAAAPPATGLAPAVSEGCLVVQRSVLPHGLCLCLHLLECRRRDMIGEWGGGLLSPPLLLLGVVHVGFLSPTAQRWDTTRRDASSWKFIRPIQPDTPLGTEMVAALHHSDPDRGGMSGFELGAVVRVAHRRTLHPQPTVAALAPAPASAAVSLRSYWSTAAAPPPPHRAASLRASSPGAAAWGLGARTCGAPRYTAAPFSTTLSLCTAARHASSSATGSDATGGSPAAGGAAATASSSPIGSSHHHPAFGRAAGHAGAGGSSTAQGPGAGGSSAADRKLVKRKDRAPSRFVRRAMQRPAGTGAAGALAGASPPRGKIVLKKKKKKRLLRRHRAATGAAAGARRRGRRSTAAQRTPTAGSTATAPAASTASPSTATAGAAQVASRRRHRQVARSAKKMKLKKVGHLKAKKASGKGKKLAVCVLSSSYANTDSETAALDNYVCSPAHYIPRGNRQKYSFHNCFVEKADAYSKIRELVSSQKYDVFFNLCDGGRDEKRAGVEVISALEDLNAAFTGADSRRFEPSKIDMKLLVQSSGVRVPNYALLKKVEGLAKRCCHLRFPVIVKHLTGYASVGIDKDSLCHNIDELRRKAATFIARYHHALVEEFIVGREGTVLATADPLSPHGVKVFRPLMFCFLQGPHDFAYFSKKWKIVMDSKAYAFLPATDPAYGSIINMARNAFHYVLNGVGYGRVDFRIDEKTGEPVFLEINPNCGMWYSEKDGGDYADIMVAGDAHWTHERFFNSAVKQAFKNQSIHRPWYLVSQDKNGAFTARATRTVAANYCLFGDMRDPVPIIAKTLFKLGGDEDPLTNTVGCVVMRADGRPNVAVTIRHSCEPNLHLIQGRTLICATKRPINAGEELSIDYGLLRDESMPRFTCTCGTKNCRSIIFATPPTARTVEVKLMRRMLREKKKQWLREKANREAERLLKKRSKSSTVAAAALGGGSGASSTASSPSSFSHGSGQECSGAPTSSSGSGNSRTSEPSREHGASSAAATSASS